MTSFANSLKYSGQVALRRFFRVGCWGLICITEGCPWTLPPADCEDPKSGSELMALTRVQVHSLLQQCRVPAVTQDFGCPCVELGQERALVPPFQHL